VPGCVYGARERSGDEIDFAPVEHDTKRLRLLTLDEAHDLLRVLRTVVQEGGAAAGEAGRLVREIGARIPSEADAGCGSGAGAEVAYVRAPLVQHWRRAPLAQRVLWGNWCGARRSSTTRCSSAPV
jgi:hypothetical protein